MAQPHSFGITTIKELKTPAQRKLEGGWAGRHGKFAKGTVLPETQVRACPLVNVADLPEGFLKKSHIEHLEQNQKISICCRHVEEHKVEAFKSHSEEQGPDIYVFHCTTCGRKHRFFCVGLHDERPYWSAD